MEKIKEDIKELVDKYHSDTEKDRQSEIDVRSNYIDKLFEVLGWNVYRKLDANDRYEREKYIRGVGYADVGIEIRGEPLFFIECKRFGKIPSVEEHKVDPVRRRPEVKQSLRYARNKGIPWAILTNFERLIVYNADEERAIIWIDSPKDYLLNEKFEELKQLIKHKDDSKVTIDRRLKWWQDLRKKEEGDLDKDFLIYLNNWRLKLAQNIYKNNRDNPDFLKNNHKFNEDLLQKSVQRILNRLIIIQYADDKEVLDDHGLLNRQIKKIKERGPYDEPVNLMTELNKLFAQFDKKHNTSIFARGHICEKVKVDNDVLLSILEEISGYSFRKFTSDILGSTYESYLGQKLVIKGEQIQPEEHRDYRKGEGIYYTPPYVVHYIVDNTLGKYLEGKRIEDIKDLKVLDPACGSGSFLIYAFDILANFYEKENERIVQEQLKASEEWHKEHGGKLDLEGKLTKIPKPDTNYPETILEKHLYGVDLDPEAAEITTVNLIMKAFEKRKRKERKKDLPLILNQNIKIGNSLISGIEKIEELEQYRNEIIQLIKLRKQLQEIEEREKEYELFKKANKILEEITPKINQKLKKINGRGYFENPENKKPFTWELEFPEVFFNDDGTLKKFQGFDVVIGNPPYVNVERIENQERKYLMDAYTTAIKRFDIYVLFCQKSINQLKSTGKFGFIIPYPFLYESYAENLRRQYLNVCCIQNIVDLSKFKVFSDAIVRNIIFIVEKIESSQKRKSNNISVLKVKQNPNETRKLIGEMFQIPQRTFDSLPEYAFRLELDQFAIELLSKIEKESLLLGDICYVNWGARTGNIKKYVLTRAINNKCKKMIDGRDIERYFVDWQKKYLLYEEDKLYNPMFRELFENEKLIIPDVSGNMGIRAAYDNEHFYTEHTVSLCVPKNLLQDVKRRGLSISKREAKLAKRYNLYYILALVNSNLLNFYFKKLFGGGLHVYPNDIKRLPIKRIDFRNSEVKKQYNKFIKLAERITTLNRDKGKITKIFKGMLNNYPYEMRSFGSAYYDNPDYSKKISKFVLTDVNQKGDVLNIEIREKNHSIIIYANDNPTIKCDISDGNLRLFIFLSIRKFLKENERRRKWGKGKIVNILLDKIQVPIFIKYNVHHKEHNLERINLLMSELKSKVLNLHLSQVEDEIEKIDNTIDVEVFKLYGLSKEEVISVLDFHRVQNEMKENILKALKK